MERPDWAPTTVQVAAYVPTRTVDDYPNPDGPSNPELGVPGLDFDDHTTPTKDQVESFLDASVSIVQSKLNPLNDGVKAVMTQAAAVRTAAMVELSSPRTDSDVNVYQELMALYNQLIIDALAANASDPSGGGTSTGNLVPQYAFPAPVPWGDDFI